MSSDQNRVWERGWADHERAQRRRLAALPLPEKLRWLEEAQALVGHLSSRRLHRPPDRSHETGRAR